MLSLFDGMSCIQIALGRSGICYNKCFASEVDKYAIKVTQDNFPNTIQLGDVLNWRKWGIDWSSIGIVSGGFPCQAWSVAGKQLGDKDERGKLFWTMLDIMKHVKFSNPNVKFLIENVRMKKEFEDYITFHTKNALGCINKYLINSSLVSAQSRNRFYWTNIDMNEMPRDKGILLKDILENEVDNKYFLSEKIVTGFLNKKSVFGDRFNPLTDKQKSGTLTARYYKQAPSDPFIFSKPKRVGSLNNGGQGDRIYDINFKSVTLSAAGGGRGAKTGLYLIPFSYTSSGRGNVVVEGRIKKLIDKSLTLTASSFNNRSFTGGSNDIGIRRLTPLECKRLQTVPDDYIMDISDTQAYKCLGNGWTVDVIAHILKGIK